MPVHATETAAPADFGSLAALLVDTSLVALALADQDHFQFANTAFCRMFGRANGLAGVAILGLIAPSHCEQVAAALQTPHGPPCVARACRGGADTFEVELRFEQLKRDGEALLAIFAQDITDRSRAQAQLSLLAYSDPLTGLANRAMFADRLRQAALLARRTGQSFAVVMLDLDGFKQINDAHGHAAGDIVLQRIAARLLACLRDTDTVARLGGDEFAILLPTPKVVADAHIVAHRLLEVARQPIDTGTSRLQVAASAGIAICPEHAATIDHLLAAADAALYAAKQRGRNRVVWANSASAEDFAPKPLDWNATHEIGLPEIDQQHARMAYLLNKLADALRNGRDHVAIFRELIRYTDHHFATEERLMEACGYEGTAAHRDMHRRLMVDLHSLQLDRGEVISVSLTTRYLQEWLLRHINGADRDLAAALSANQREAATCDAGGGTAAPQ